MKQKTIKTDKATLLVVELPEVVREIQLNNQGWISYMEGNHPNRRYENIPEGNWQLLGRLPDITESQAERIIPDYYHKHIREDAKWYWALLFDFLKENEIWFENPLGEHHPIHPSYKGVHTSLFEYETQCVEWQEAQSKVWDKDMTYLFIKVD